MKQAKNQKKIFLEKSEHIERGEILSDPDSLIAELRKREVQSYIKSIPVDEAIPDGWQVKKRFSE